MKGGSHGARFGHVGCGPAGSLRAAPAGRGCARRQGPPGWGARGAAGLVGRVHAGAGGDAGGTRGLAPPGPGSQARGRLRPGGGGYRQTAPRGGVQPLPPGRRPARARADAPVAAARLAPADPRARHERGRRPRSERLAELAPRPSRRGGLPGGGGAARRDAARGLRRGPPRPPDIRRLRRRRPREFSCRRSASTPRPTAPAGPRSPRSSAPRAPTSCAPRSSPQSGCGRGTRTSSWARTATCG